MSVSAALPELAQIDVWNYPDEPTDKVYAVRDAAGVVVSEVRYKGMSPRPAGGFDGFLAAILSDPKRGKAIAHYLEAHPDELDDLAEQMGGEEIREKAWTAWQHPRADNGQFVSKGDIHAAASDPKKAKALEARVTDPKQKVKLADAIEHAQKNPQDFADVAKGPKSKPMPSADRQADKPAKVDKSARPEKRPVGATEERIHQLRKEIGDGYAGREHLREVAGLLANHTVAELRELKKSLGITTSRDARKEQMVAELGGRSLRWAKEQMAAVKAGRAKRELTTKLRKDGHTGTDEHGRNWEGGKIVKPASVKADTPAGVLAKKTSEDMAKPTETALAGKKPGMKPNTVSMVVRDNYGQELGRIHEPHDGTDQGMKAAANKLTERAENEFSDWSNMQSTTGASDHTGTPKFVISPNRNHVNPIETDAGKYSLGLLDYAPKELQPGKVAGALPAGSQQPVNFAADFDKRMAQVDPRDSGNVDVPAKAKPLAIDDRDVERFDAAKDKQSRMEGWAADKPNSVAADDAARSAGKRVEAAKGEEEWRNYFPNSEIHSTRGAAKKRADELSAGGGTGSDREYRTIRAGNGWGIQSRQKPDADAGTANSRYGGGSGKPVSKMTDDEFASTVQKIADGHTHGFHDNKVFLADVEDELRKVDPSMTTEQFHDRLRKANAGQKLGLSRADMVSAMDPEYVKRSEMQGLKDKPGQSTFHFIRRTKPKADAITRGPTGERTGIPDGAMPEYAEPTVSHPVSQEFQKTVMRGGEVTERDVRAAVAQMGAGDMAAVAKDFGAPAGLTRDALAKHVAQAVNGGTANSRYGGGADGGLSDKAAVSDAGKSGDSGKPDEDLSSLRQKLSTERKEMEGRHEQEKKTLSGKLARASTRKQKDAIQSEWSTVQDGHRKESSEMHARHMSEIQSHPEYQGEHKASLDRVRQRQSEESKVAESRKADQEKSHWDSVQSEGGKDAVLEKLSKELSAAKRAHSQTKESNKWKSQSAVDRVQKQIDYINTLAEKFGGESAEIGKGQSSTSSDPSSSRRAGESDAEYSAPTERGNLFDLGDEDKPEAAHHKAMNDILARAGRRFDRDISPRAHAEDSLDQFEKIDGHLSGKAKGVLAGDDDHTPFKHTIDSYRDVVKRIDEGEFDIEDKDFDTTEKLTGHAHEALDEGGRETEGAGYGLNHLLNGLHENGHGEDAKWASKYHDQLHAALKDDIAERIKDRHELTKSEEEKPADTKPAEAEYQPHEDANGNHTYRTKQAAQKALANLPDTHEGHVVAAGGGWHTVMSRKKADATSDDATAQPAVSDKTERLATHADAYRKAKEKTGPGGVQYRQDVLHAAAKDLGVERHEAEDMIDQHLAGNMPSTTSQTPSDAPAAQPAAAPTESQSGFHRTTPATGTPEREALEKKYDTNLKGFQSAADQMADIDKRMGRETNKSAVRKLTEQRKELADQRQTHGDEYEKARLLIKTAKLEDLAGSDKPEHSLPALMELNHPSVERTGPNSAYNRLKQVVSDEAKRHGVHPDHHDDVVMDTIIRQTGWDMHRPLEQNVREAHDMKRTTAAREAAAKELGGLNLSGPGHRNVITDARYATHENMPAILDKARAYHAENEAKAEAAKSAEQKKQEEFEKSPAGLMKRVLDTHTGWHKPGESGDGYTLDSIVKSTEGNSKNFAATIHDGILTDGKMVAVLPEKQKAKLLQHKMVQGINPAEDESTAATSTAGSARKMVKQWKDKEFNGKANRKPAAVVAHRPDADSPVYHLRDEDGQEAAVNGHYHDTILKMHKGATAHISDREGGPVLYKKGGETVAAVMGYNKDNMRLPKDAESLPDAPHQIADHFERSVPDEQVGVSETKTKGGLKQFTVHNQHDDIGQRSYVTVSETPGDKGTYSIRHRSDKKPLAQGLSKKKAEELASHIVAHAHGEDENGLVFKPKSTPPADGKKKAADVTTGPAADAADGLTDGRDTANSRYGETAGGGIVEKGTYDTLAEAVQASGYKNAGVERVADTPSPAPSDPEPAAKPTAKTDPSEPYSLAHHDDMRDRLNAGTITADELRDGYAGYRANEEGIKEQLGKHKLDNLKKLSGSWHAGGMKKGELIDHIYRQMGREFLPHGSMGSYMLSGPNSERDHVMKRVGELTDDHIKAHAEAVAKSRAERKAKMEKAVESVKNPQTLDDYRNLIRTSGGYDKLTPEQQAKHDDLHAEARRGRSMAERQEKAKISGFSGGEEAAGDIGIVVGHHNKRNVPTHTVTVANRLGDEKFAEALGAAKRLGGSYVNARIAQVYGATPGFQFFDEAKAKQFADVLRGQSVDRSADVAGEMAGRLSNRADSLADRGAALEQAGQEKYEQDRLENTYRQSAQAASARADAQKQIAHGRTLRQIGEGQASGELKHLNGVRSAEDLHTLDRALHSARWDRIREAQKREGGLSYRDREAMEQEPHSHADVTAVKYPHPTIHQSEMRDIARTIKDEPGLKRFAEKFAKMGDIYGDVKFQGSVGGMKANGGKLVGAEHLKDHPDAEYVASMLKDKDGNDAMARVHASHDWRLHQAATKNDPTAKSFGAFYTADKGKTWGVSPEVAISATLNKGHQLDLVTRPDDKVLTMDHPDDIDAMRNAAKKLARYPSDRLRRIGQSLKEKLEHYDRLKRADIHSTPELRAALREYLPLRKGADKEDPVKRAERELKGNTIEGFFPTPKPIIEDMLDRADIQSGHKVLEPSAGKGDILDAISERHPDAETHAIEPHSSLRNILNMKGHNVVGNDFLQHAEGDYDRIVMNPPFERGQDGDHVRAAYEKLRPGGRLVGIMSEGPFNRSDKKSQAFREWLDSVGGQHEQMDENSFNTNDAFRKTGVRTRMVTIDKPHGDPSANSRTEAPTEKTSPTPDPEPASPPPAEATVKRQVSDTEATEPAREPQAEAPAPSVPEPTAVEPVSAGDKEFNSEPPAKANPAVPSTVRDFGEEIGGARKHTAKPIGPRSAEAKAKQADAVAKPAWARHYETHQDAKTGEWFITHGKKTDGWGGPKIIYVGGKRGSFSTKEEAEQAIPLHAAARTHGVRNKARSGEEPNYEIYRRVTDRKMPTVKDGFKTHEEAMRHMALHPEDVLNHKFPDWEDQSYLDAVSREGPEHKKGDVTTDDFHEAFGFRGGQFGKWQENADGQKSLNHAYHALHDLAHVTGLSPKQLSLGGKLGIAFGARGTGGKHAAKAHYEPEEAVINLTKMKGAGSLGHEWFHALDHAIAKGEHGDLTDRLLTSHLPYKAKNDEVVSAFKNLVDTMSAKHVTNAVNESQAKKSHDYAHKAVQEALQGVQSGYDNALRWHKQDTEKGRKSRVKPFTADQQKQWDALHEKIKAGDLGAVSHLPGGLAIHERVAELDKLHKAATGRSLTAGGADSKANALHWALKRKQDAEKRVADAGAGAEETKKARTDFLNESVRLDSTSVGDYYSLRHEMAARAFAAYLHDKLHGDDRKSEYLTAKADNKHYMFGDKPYPEGEERTAINGAFDKLFEAVRKHYGSQSEGPSSADDSAGKPSNYRPSSADLKAEYKRLTTEASQRADAEDEAVRNRYRKG